MSVPHRHAVDLTTSDENLSDTTPPAPPTERTTNHRPAAAGPAPSTPPHVRHANSQQPPATADEIACPICLSAIHHTERGPMSLFEWPHCGHALHTGCAAHLFVEQPGGPPCPSCRQPWLSTSAELFHAQCQQRGVNLPEPLTSYDTRTNAPVPPPAPRHTVPLCCHRVTFSDTAHPERGEVHVWKSPGWRTQIQPRSLRALSMTRHRGPCWWQTGRSGTLWSNGFSDVTVALHLRQTHSASQVLLGWWWFRVHCMWRSGSSVHAGPRARTQHSTP